ncbi:MAG: hypothetical protein ACKO26_00295, partial [Planctomycetota bacterium]
MPDPVDPSHDESNPPGKGNQPSRPITSETENLTQPDSAAINSSRTLTMDGGIKRDGGDHP